MINQDYLTQYNTNFGWRWITNGEICIGNVGLCWHLEYGNVICLIEMWIFKNDFTGELTGFPRAQHLIGIL